MSYKIRFMFSDVTQLAGYQAASENCPSWKAAKIEKKNKELVEKEKVSLIKCTLNKRVNTAASLAFIFSSLLLEFLVCSAHHLIR